MIIKYFVIYRNELGGSNRLLFLTLSSLAFARFNVVFNNNANVLIISFEDNTDQFITPKFVVD